MKVPEHYVPNFLSKKSKKKQKKELKKSRENYKKGKYYTRKKIREYKSKRSPWINRFKKLYSLPDDTELTLNRLEKLTKCKKKGLKDIIRKGKGAYYSSGSRPNQTADSWGKARLYSTLSGGPASQYDKDILEEYCANDSKSLKLAEIPRKNTRRQKIDITGGKLMRMKETIKEFKKSPIKGKKYRAIIENNKTKKQRHIDFGGLGYQQYKDRTGKGLYSNIDHNDKKRMRNYFNRHSGTPKRGEAIKLERKKSNGYYNAKILSHEYLW